MELRQTQKLAEFNLEKVSFVAGNGTSRSTVDLNVLQQHGTLYGCNALYREMSPDYLVAVDAKMVLEISKTGYQHSNQVWTNPNKTYSKLTGFNFFKPSKGWSSGPTALHLAADHNPDKIYILGFDYVGIGDANSLINNVYADTVNYKKKQERATYYGNWLKQTTTTIQKFPKIKFIRVVSEVIQFVPSEFEKLNNLEHITVTELKNKYNC